MPPSAAPPSIAPSLLAIRLRPYAQLVRLPNVFTAFADIALGALATHALPERWFPFLLLLLASGCLYCGGMVWNDFFDVEQDTRERPHRPIPAGLVSRRSAGQLGAALLLVGVLCAALVGMPSLILAVLLVGAILLYDGWLKRTSVGPISMGLCRFLDVLLATTVRDGSIPSMGWHLAAVVGVYIVGVTWFARHGSSPQQTARPDRRRAGHAGGPGAGGVGAGVGAAGDRVAALSLSAGRVRVPGRHSRLPGHRQSAAGTGAGGRQARRSSAWCSSTPSWPRDWRGRSAWSLCCCCRRRCIWASGCIPPDEPCPGPNAPIPPALLPRSGTRYRSFSTGIIRTIRSDTPFCSDPYRKSRFGFPEFSHW